MSLPNNIESGLNGCGGLADAGGGDNEKVHAAGSRESAAFVHIQLLVRTHASIETAHAAGLVDGHTK